ncbi:PTS lactose/cellobiose transporter subunit IIA [Clostridiales bacterium COT073_COT-073]|nr:PTS lactose/cellobiose transporter subunit IIA [Clostridiales bacterium COT073_COT-073]
MAELLYCDDDEIVQVAMQIIIESGEARKSIAQALDFIAVFDFENARLQISEANQHICKAHNAQTARMQAEISQANPFTPSILFNHAQDTLMTVMSEIHLTEKHLTVFENFYKLLPAKEEK